MLHTTNGNRYERREDGVLRSLPYGHFAHRRNKPMKKIILLQDPVPPPATYYMHKRKVFYSFRCDIHDIEGPRSLTGGR
jgi:cephalosporin-C deacetylase-like acetyl esterase